MSDKAPFWVVPVMRGGYAARGLVYLIVGVLSVMSAITSGQAEGTKAQLAQLKSAPLGHTALWLIAVGLLLYALWRWINAAMDLEDHGTDAKGLVARGGLIVTGLIYAGLGVSVALMTAGLDSGGGSGAGGSGAEGATAQLMQMPFGRWLVGLAGLGFLGAMGYYFYKAYSEKYKSHLRRTTLTEKLDPVVKAGLVAHGVAVGLIGGFLIFAALRADSDEAGGLGQAFDTVRDAPFGQVLLILLAAGLVAFAIYCFIEAVYRILPSRAGPDVQTLARKADPTG